ncbi:MAG: hypothetical protein E7575_03950 [Ruminococcaceae bacterium]|nr:hypothetical protein [Oscillospiraceae bacterium]
MGKTKLGVSAGLLGAAVCLVCLFGSGMGYIGTFVLLGYVLLFEENIWLKRTAVKAAVLMFIFALISVFIGFIPDFMEIIRNLMSLFNKPLEGDAVYMIESKIPVLLSNVVNFAKYIFFIALAVKSLGQKTIIIPALDRMLNKHFN